MGTCHSLGHMSIRPDTRKPPILLTIAVDYGDHPDTDILLNRQGRVIKHPYGGSDRMSTEEERAAVGWTW